MKALTVKQPWAQLICTGIKDVENRTWKTNFRGRVLIHASAKDFDFKTHMTSEYQREFIKKIKKPYIHSTIIGSVEIIDCILSKDDSFQSWGDFWCYHWKLANPVLFSKPIENVKGKLSFWESGYEMCPICSRLTESLLTCRLCGKSYCADCASKYSRIADKYCSRCLDDCV